MELWQNLKESDPLWKENSHLTQEKIGLKILSYILGILFISNIEKKSVVLRLNSSRLNMNTLFIALTVTRVY